MLMFRPETGEPLALLDARLITEMRTSAVSAVATKALAAFDARVLAVLGTGVQARTHVDALSRVRRFEEIRVWGRSEEKARRLAEQVGGVSTSAEAASHVVVVESRAGTARDSGNLRGSGVEAYAELGEVLDGRRPVDRTATTIFDSVGMAAEDLAAAGLVLAKAGVR